MTESIDARIDSHSHIIHADIGEMVSAAKANGLAEYSITEHISQFKELKESVRFGSVHTSGRIFGSIDEYAREFDKVDGQTLGTRICRGLEVDFAPRFEAKVADFVNQSEWDILLCSVHEFENTRDVERIVGKRYGPGGAFEDWRDYFRLQQLALESDFVPFQVLAHPVRMSRGVEQVPPEMDTLLLDLAKTAERHEKALELNGNDIDYAPQLVRRLATACSKAGCKVSLGSDAHYPKSVYRNIARCASLAKEFDFGVYHVVSG